MKWKIPGLNRKLLLIPPLLLGIVVVSVLVANRKTPRREPEREEARTVRVIDVAAVDVVPRALGYGTARPGQVWRVISEVRGRVARIHPQLESGAMVQEGETLLEIDAAEYQLAIALLEAEISQVEAQMEELSVNEANDGASLKIEQASLALAEKELQRLQTLFERGATSPSAIDQQNRNVLMQQQSVQRLQNSLKLIPQQRKSLEAMLAVKQAGLGQAKLDLAKTIITAPFDCRLGEVEIQPGQFLAAGQTLFEAHGTALAEVEIQIALDQLRTLISPEHTVRLPLDMDAETIQKLFDFQVIVRYRSGDFQPEWEGRVTGMREQLDPRTRTVGLVISVERPYEQAIPGRKPPLIQGMYCEAELRGKVRKSRIVVPRSALHDGHVYVVDDDSRLQRRKVEVAFAQSSFLCLSDGLRDGETLIVSDLTPAIDGLLVDPVVDRRLQQQLVFQAAAKGSLK